MAIKGELAIWEAETDGIELLNWTIGDLLDRQAHMRPEKEALVYAYPEQGLHLRLTYQQYRTAVDLLAKGLLALGIRKDTHVAIWAQNVPEWILLHLALARIGAVMITLNTAYKTAEVEYVLRQGDVSHLFLTEGFRGNSFLASLSQVVPELTTLIDPLQQTLQSARLPHLKRVVLIGASGEPGLLPYDQLATLAERITDAELEEHKARVTPQDIALIMYTSGTTGFPKGAMLTHSNLINTQHMLARGQDLSADRYVNPMPLFHISGVNSVLAALLNGMTLIQLIAFDPTKELELLTRERGTISCGVPTMFIALLAHPGLSSGAFDLSALRLIYTGGTTIPTVLMEQLKARMGAECTILFGQTESTASGTMTLDEDSFERKSTTVGKPTPYLDLKIIDPLTGQAVRLGERGEVLLRGFAVMKGYYNMLEKTVETLDRENWLHTGDLATMDAEGYVRVVGRVKDMIIRGGENVYPAEIEQLLMRHAKVADAQVVGVPDARMGEEAAAAIRLKPGEQATSDELREYCLAHISRYKVPRYFLFVMSYPLTASGKIKKFELRTQLMQQLGMQEDVV